MIESDSPAQEKTVAYESCIRNCQKDCIDSKECAEKFGGLDNEKLQTMCSDTKCKEIMVNGQPQIDERKGEVSFKPHEIWQLFENWSSFIDGEKLLRIDVEQV